MKFSIRDLFWLMLLAACCVMWWLDRGRLSRLQEDVARREAEERALTARLFQFMATTQTTRAGTVSAGVDPADKVLGGAGEPADPD
jgi:hypothetical protein